MVVPVLSALTVPAVFVVILAADRRSAARMDVEAIDMPDLSIPSYPLGWRRALVLAMLWSYVCGAAGVALGLGDWFWRQMAVSFVAVVALDAYLYRNEFAERLGPLARRTWRQCAVHTAVFAGALIVLALAAAVVKLTG